jgi:hypothetical protein
LRYFKIGSNKCLLFQGKPLLTNQQAQKIMDELERNVPRRSQSSQWNLGLTRLLQYAIHRVANYSSRPGNIEKMMEEDWEFVAKHFSGSKSWL